ncbi:predicted protein [Nematostella vectensis]|uniref:AMP-dependent synthetase/ligase domain-containing protein n=1 Tax=Nematostella vectensis TaxID=45351 RepID=A7RW72_NEMVE|nr:predicted protein [Nematostella vectensis]|eukprot:XP_001636279.1 predicted protein [Nematostella vectensis]
MSAGQSYYHKPRSQLLDNRLLHDLLDWQAANHPTDDALVHYDENKHRHNLSYATYRTQSRDLAAGLRNLGFSTADRLLIIAPNGLQYCVAMMAVSRIGACAVLMSTSGRRELDRFTAELLRKICHLSLVLDKWPFQKTNGQCGKVLDSIERRKIRREGGEGRWREDEKDKEDEQGGKRGENREQEVEGRWREDEKDKEDEQGGKRGRTESRRMKGIWRKDEKDKEDEQGGKRWRTESRRMKGIWRKDEKDKEDEQGGKRWRTESRRLKGRCRKDEKDKEDEQGGKRGRTESRRVEGRWREDEKDKEDEQGGKRGRTESRRVEGRWREDEKDKEDEQGGKRGRTESRKVKGRWRKDEKDKEDEQGEKRGRTESRKVKRRWRKDEKDKEDEQGGKRGRTESRKVEGRWREDEKDKRMSKEERGGEQRAGRWGIKGVLCDIGTNMKLLNGLRMLAPHLHAIVYRGTQPSVHGCAIHSYDWLIETGKSLTTSDVYHDAKDPMFVVLTSGTSGPCKASVISSYALINGHNLDTQGPQGPRNLALFNYKPMSVSSFLPIFALALIRGYRVVSVPHTLGCGRLEWVLSVIAAEGCATCSLPLNLVEDLVNRPSLVAKFPLPRITTFGFGGQFVPRKLIVSLLKLYPKTRAIYLYASTETFMTSIQIVTNQTREEQYGVMSIVPDVEVKVVDDVGNIVAMGTPGEILVRGVKTFLGYIDDTDMSSRAITAEGWVRTGDSGYFPEYGKLKLLGRLTDVVYKEVEASILHQPTPTILHFSIVKPLTRAANADKRDIDKVLVLLYPREIEEMLERHDGVTRAVVVGGDNSNDTICACVTGMKSRLGGLSEWWDEEFGVSFWKPERFVYLEKMPYAPSLKVDRWAIQRRVFSQ